MSRFLGLHAVQWVAVVLHLFVLVWTIARHLRIAQAVGLILWAVAGLSFYALLALYHTDRLHVDVGFINLVSASLHAYANMYVAVFVVLLTHSFKEDTDGIRSVSGLP